VFNPDYIGIFLMIQYSYMYMLSMFGDLLTFSLLAPFIIRLFLGLYFVLWGWSLLRKPAEGSLFKKYFLSAISLVGGIFVAVGFLTQIATLFLMILSLYLAKRDSNRVTFILLFAMALSLLFSGAGFFAFDLPL